MTTEKSVNKYMT